MKKKIKTKKLSAAVKLYLKPLLPNTRIAPSQPLTEKDFAEFKIIFSPRSRAQYKRQRRKSVEDAFGKPLEKLTLKEFRDFNKPNFQAQFYLGELWKQLNPDEREIVKQLNEWAFTFPASFEAERDFLLACAGRLKRFFGRTFVVAKSDP